jgi:phosphoribosylformylglycinamidine synthase subunit PurQ / glutaminase
VSKTPPAGRKPRVIVLRAPGVNCDQETAFAFERTGAEVATLHVNRLLEDRAPLDGADLLCVPGGFSFGDDLGAGKILGNKLALKLRGSVLRLVDKGGLVLGICNGFQVLVRAGILPGTRGVFEQEASLARNLSGKFEARWVRLETTAVAHTPFLRRGEVWDAPSAHGEGRLVLREPAVLERMKAQGQIALRYRRPGDGEHPGVNGSAVASGEAGYPWNPSGSTEDIAGITDPTGRVFGLMPHPERHQDAWQRPGHTRERWTSGARANPAGLELFARAVEALRTQGGARRREGALA